MAAVEVSEIKRSLSQASLLLKLTVYVCVCVSLCVYVCDIANCLYIESIGFLKEEGKCERGRR